MTRIALFQFDQYFPPLTGSAKYGHKLMELLGTAGHECAVLSVQAADDVPVMAGQSVAALRASAHSLVELPDRSITYKSSSVSYHFLAQDQERMDGSIWRFLNYFSPELSLISDETCTLRDSALRLVILYGRSRLVYCVHVVNNLPFGRFSHYRRKDLESLLYKVDFVLTTSNFAQSYIAEHIQKPVVVLHPPLSAPARPSAPPAGRTAAIVNPCRYKGIDAFLKIADAMPRRKFIAVPGWGTSAQDKSALALRPNVRIERWRPQFSEILDQTAVLLAPSAWQETFGMAVIDAMSFGVPVIASAAGGLPEAKLNVDFTLPLPEMTFVGDGTSRVADPDVSAWVKTLDYLFSDETARRQLAQASRDAALRFIDQECWRLPMLERALCL